MVNGDFNYKNFNGVPSATASPTNNSVNNVPNARNGTIQPVNEHSSGGELGRPADYEAVQALLMLGANLLLEQQQKQHQDTKTIDNVPQDLSVRSPVYNLNANISMIPSPVYNQFSPNLQQFHNSTLSSLNNSSSLLSPTHSLNSTTSTQGQTPVRHFKREVEDHRYSMSPRSDHDDYNNQPHAILPQQFLPHQLAALQRFSPQPFVQQQQIASLQQFSPQRFLQQTQIVPQHFNIHHPMAIDPSDSPTDSGHSSSFQEDSILNTMYSNVLYLARPVLDIPYRNKRESDLESIAPYDVYITFERIDRDSKYKKHDWVQVEAMKQPVDYEYNPSKSRLRKVYDDPQLEAGRVKNNHASRKSRFKKKFTSKMMSLSYEYDMQENRELYQQELWMYDIVSQLENMAIQRGVDTSVLKDLRRKCGLR